MVAIKPTIGLCKRTAGLEEGNRKPKHPLLAAGLRFWPPTLCFRGKLRSFYLFEGMGSFSLTHIQVVHVLHTLGAVGKKTFQCEFDGCKCQLVPRDVFFVKQLRFLGFKTGVELVAGQR